ncbi:Uma2 family endonuclease [bacterium]|nr:Uma2 family endonuclease [bacterium]
MQLTTRKWTCDEYQRLAEIGLLAENERIELIQGDIVSMTPVDPLHSNAVGQATGKLFEIFGATHSVRVQLPLRIGTNSEPEPDFCLILLEVARQLMRNRRHPEGADLVVEISNTSLAYDQGYKASLYASGQIPLYWVVDLRAEVVEVYSQPAPDPKAPTGWSYAITHRHARGQRLEFAGRSIPVDDFLPPVD